MIPLDDTWRWAMQAVMSGSIVLAAGSVAVALVRAPVRRARLATWTLAGSLVVPVLAGLPGLPRWAVVPTGPAPSALGRIEPVPVAPARGFTPFRDPEPDASLVVLDPSRVAVLPTREPESSPAPLDLRPILLVAWGLTGAGWLTWWTVGVVLLQRISRSARPVAEPVAACFAGVAGAGGGRVRLRVSDQVALPVTFTWVRPTIILPVDLAGADPAATPELQFALAHEWSHVERRDHRSWTLGSLAGTLWVIHPLFWWLRRQLRLSQDFLADDRAAGSEAPEEFAAYLVRLARTRLDRARFPLPALGIGGRASHLTRRVLMLLADRPPLARRCRPLWTGAAAIFALLTLVAAAGVRLDAAPPEEPHQAVEVNSKARFAFVALPQQPVPAQNAGGRIEDVGDSPKRPAPPDLLRAADGAREWTGQIVDSSTGQPVAGAQVRVNISSSRQLSKLPPRDVQTTTPKDGSYRFTLTAEEQADPALYLTLYVDHPDHIRYAAGYSYAMLVKNIDLGERPFFEKLGLFPAVPIEGLVLKPDGTPAVGVKVKGYTERDLAREGHEFGQFCDTSTDERGHFRLPIHPQGKAMITLIPERFAPEVVLIRDNRRGDLGTFRLGAGLRVTGKVLDSNGQPVAGVFVTGSHDDDALRRDPAMPMGVATSLDRSAATGADGTFVLPPLPPGLTEVKPTADNWDPLARELATSPPSRSLPGVFLATKVTLVAGQDPEPVILRGLPQVTVTAQITDSKGNKRGGFETFLRGKLGGEWWSARYQPSGNGLYTMVAPKGLENAQFNLMTNEHTAFRHRMAQDAPLSGLIDVQIGTLDHDVRVFEIIRFVAPLVLIKATTRDGKPVPGLKPAVNLVPPDPKERRYILKGGYTSSLVLEGPQEDGRFRTASMQPDTDYEVIVKADGFASQTRRVKLAEGNTEEVVFVMEPN